MRDACLGLKESSVPDLPKAGICCAMQPSDVENILFAKFRFSTRRQEQGHCSHSSSKYGTLETKSDLIFVLL